MRTLSLAAPLMMAVFAWGCSTSISASDYDQACEVDTDCVAVAQGERCAIERCGCASAAINVVDAEQYEADMAALVCTDPFNDLGPVCLCAATIAVCEGGTCVSGRDDAVD